MRLHDAKMARRWRNKVLTGLMVLSGLAVVGLPDSQAQMYYSGGLRPLNRHPLFTSRQTSESTTTGPKTPPSFFPDNDVAYPSYYLGSQPSRPLPSSTRVWPYSVLPTDLPWDRADFEDYNEALSIPRDTVIGQPRKYLLTATPFAPEPAEERLDKAVLIAHLPEYATFWVEGTRTRSAGRTRYFLSPPLLPGRKYNYRVSVAWIEDGHWVSQTHLVPVQAGLIQAIYLRPTPVIPAKAAMRSIPE